MITVRYICNLYHVKINLYTNYVYVNLCMIKLCINTYSSKRACSTDDRMNNTSMWVLPKLVENQNEILLDKSSHASIIYI